MSIHQLAANHGILKPDDLTLLQSVYEEAVRLDPTLDEDQSADVARRLMLLFTNGTRDRLVLLAAVARQRRTG